MHHKFKWVLCVNHTEPVKNYLNRYHERRLVDFETKLLGAAAINIGNSNQQQQIHLIEQNIRELRLVYEWLPKLWLHVNKYIEMYNSIDLTIGPKVLTSCPLDFRQAETWFVALWNESLVPAMIDIIREGIQAYDTNLSGWEDPKEWLRETLPWNAYNPSIINSLKTIESKDLGVELVCAPPAQLVDETSSLSVVRRRVSDAAAAEDNDFARMHTRVSQFMSCQNTPAKQSIHGGMCRNSNDSDKLLSMLLKLQEATMRSSMSISEEHHHQNGNSIDCDRLSLRSACPAAIKAFEANM